MSGENSININPLKSLTGFKPSVTELDSYEASGRRSKTSNLLSPPANRPISPSNQSTLIQSSAAVSVSISNLARIQLETAEGDNVMISLGESFEYTQSRSQLLSGNSFRSSEQVSTQQQSSAISSITGELSEQELEDINQFIARVSELASDFFEGDLESVLGTFSELSSGNASSIQGFDISLSSSFLAEYTRQQVVTSANPVNLPPAATPSVLDNVEQPLLEDILAPVQPISLQEDADEAILDTNGLNQIRQIAEQESFSIQAFVSQLFTDQAVIQLDPAGRMTQALSEFLQK